MKSFIALALLVAVAAALPSPPVSVLRYENNNIGLEGYNYGWNYTTADGVTDWYLGLDTTALKVIEEQRTLTYNEANTYIEGCCVKPPEACWLLFAELPRFETSDGTKRQEEGQLNNVGSDSEGISVQGSFSFIADDGVEYTVNYKGDENGFQAQGAHLPVSP